MEAPNLGDTFDNDYPSGLFETDGYLGSAAPSTVAVVVVTEIDGKLIVALPSEAWHRNKIHKMLGSGGMVPKPDEEDELQLKMYPDKNREMTPAKKGPSAREDELDEEEVH